MPTLRFIVAAPLLLALAPATAWAEDVAPGLYRASEGPDLASRLLIASDGHFRYMLAYGALDEQAEGYWKRTQDGIALYTDPRPKPPVFTLAAKEPVGDAPFALHVVWPDGSEIAGIDFRLGFANGETAETYTGNDGWAMGEDARGAPVWIELFDAIHGIASPRFALDPGTRLVRIVYTPNDLGIADFDGAPVTMEDGRLLLHRGEGVIHYVTDDK